MCNLRIRELIFGSLNTKTWYFKVEDFKKTVTLIVPVRDLYLNLDLLNEFSAKDIRTISYFAAEEEVSLDQAYLRKCSRDRDFQNKKMKKSRSSCNWF